MWLENLNLRGSYKAVILKYIQEKYPVLLPLHQEIYLRGHREYWKNLDKRIRAYAEKSGLEYRRDDDSMTLPFDAKPIIVNFYGSVYECKIPTAAARIDGELLARHT